MPRNTLGLAVYTTALSLCLLAWAPFEAVAADHADAPLTQADAAADIADFFAWHTPDGRLIVILTFSALQAPGSDPSWDGDVLYSVHIAEGDSVGALDAAQRIDVRFGQNGVGAWGVQVMGVPGEVEPVVGPVETVVEGANGSRVWAGQADDPFFFDLQGFQDSLATADLSFTGADALAGTNVTAIALDMDLDAVTGGSPTPFLTWATTGRR